MSESVQTATDDARATRSEREYDVVLFGATGFTGELTAQYLAKHAGSETRGALAGRNLDKLEQVRKRLAEINIACAQLPLLKADINDPGSVRALAESTKVVITTVGPYIHYGEPLVKACAAAGTDYVDLTGEPEFVDLMWLRYHDQAVSTGARIIHSCGFDSIPHDLGVLYTVQQLPEGVPLTINGYVRVGGTFSGGTYHSAINAAARLRHAARNAAQRRKLEGKPTGRRIHGIVGRPHRQADAGGWVVPAPTIDPQIILRSARALDRYGPDFSYGHWAVFKRAASAAALIGGAGVGVALAQLPPTRNLLLRIKDPGEGPSAEQREKSWFKVRFVGSGGGQKVVTEVSGGDPGYGETSKMLAESALCLAHDSLPETAGQVTTAAAMGDALLGRLQRAGIEFKVV
jgi:short subunit dehydrogenase-like uncharacterized protein